MCSSCSMGSAIAIKRSTFMTKEIRFCLRVDEAPSLPGAYAMAIELSDEVAVTFSDCLRIALPAGRYLYCGSAKGPGGLKARLSRHMRRGKSVRWHVDQLTEQGLVIGSWIFPGGDECRFVQMCSHLPMPIAGFGSSDSRPAAVICCSGRTGGHYYCPTLISADAFLIYTFEP
jgi:Uri superfamily endonuclease